MPNTQPQTGEKVNPRTGAQRATTTPVLPPMLARMPDPTPRCSYGTPGFCTEPAVAETVMLWERHYTDAGSLADLFDTFRPDPVCAEHLRANQDVFAALPEAGKVFIARQVADGREDTSDG